MTFININQSLFTSIMYFLVGTVIIAFAGTKMAKMADKIADKTGMGEAVTGTLFLGFTTALPGIAATVTTAIDGWPAITVSNALGGIAIQTVFLAIADIAYRRANLEHAAASVTNMVQTGFLIFLLALTLLGFIGPNWMTFHFNPISVLLFFTAGIAIFIVTQSNIDPMWHPRFTHETVEDVANQDSHFENLTKLLTQFAVSAFFVLASGVIVAEAAQGITEKTPLSETFVGGIFLAIATSLPELFTTIAAVRIGALTLAIADIVGGNFFDCLFIAIGDFFYTEGSIYHAKTISSREPLWALLCIILNLTLLIGLLMRQKRGPANIGVESVLMLFFYLGGVFLLFLRSGF